MERGSGTATVEKTQQLGAAKTGERAGGGIAWKHAVCALLAQMMGSELDTQHADLPPGAPLHPLPPHWPQDLGQHFAGEVAEGIPHAQKVGALTA